MRLRPVFGYAVASPHQRQGKKEGLLRPEEAGQLRDDDVRERLPESGIDEYADED